MCCRFLLLKEHLREILLRLGVAPDESAIARYNIAPSTAVKAVRPTSRAAAPTLEVADLRWGLVPAWARTDEPAGRLVNARAETLATKPSFRDAFRSRRCIVPASGFYEWSHQGRGRLPWVFQRRDEAPFGLAALWESWRAPDGTAIESCAVVTTPPGALMDPIHHRQPLILAPDQFSAWLDPRTTESAALAPFMRPFPDEEFTVRRVSRHVSTVGSEGPECLAPAEPTDPPAAERDGPQLNLW